MLIRHWLTPTTARVSTSVPFSFLQDDGGDGRIAAANEELSGDIKYHHYDATLRVQIAKHACENGNKSTVENYLKELGYKLSERTMKNFKRTYPSKLKNLDDAFATTSLPHASLGRSLLIGDLMIKLLLIFANFVRQEVL